MCLKQNNYHNFLIILISLFFQQISTAQVVIKDSVEVNDFLTQSSPAIINYTINATIFQSAVFSYTNYPKIVFNFGGQNYDPPILNCALGCFGQGPIYQTINSQSNSFSLIYTDYSRNNQNIPTDFKSQIPGINENEKYEIYFNYPNPNGTIYGGTISIQKSSVLPLPNWVQMYQFEDGLCNTNIGNTDIKICVGGCALTCLTMILKGYGVDVDILTLNNYLKNNNGFDGVVVKWYAINDFASQQIIKYGGRSGESTLKFKEINGYQYADPQNSVPLNLQSIDQFLVAGYPVIVNVANYHSADNLYRPHYVIVTHKDNTLSGTSAYQILDPGSTGTTSLASFSGNIYQWIYYISK